MGPTASIESRGTIPVVLRLIPRVRTCHEIANRFTLSAKNGCEQLQQRPCELILVGINSSASLGVGWNRRP